MSRYGVHPTCFRNESNSRLYSSFRENIYTNLSESQKLELLQEVVNRAALDRGEVGAPEVRFENLSPRTWGEAGNGVIKINRDMAVKGVSKCTYNGQTIEKAIPSYNCQALNTVIHENEHCFQDQITDGTIQIDDKQLSNEYLSNRFTTSVIENDDRILLGSQYMTGETPNGYFLYYFQSTERDAHLEAENKTLDILYNVSKEYGAEPSFETYYRYVLATGYQATEQEAIQRFQNPDFVKELNQTLQNTYFGTDVPVDPQIEQAVKDEMVATHISLMNGAKHDGISVHDSTEILISAETELDDGLDV